MGRRDRGAEAELVVWLQGAETNSHEPERANYSGPIAVPEQYIYDAHRRVERRGRWNYIAFINKLGHNGGRTDVFVAFYDFQ